MDAAKIASRIYQLKFAIASYEECQKRYAAMGDDANADRMAEGISEMRQELHELRLANSEA